jgi:hypothetical protein
VHQICFSQDRSHPNINLPFIAYPYLFTHLSTGNPPKSLQSPRKMNPQASTFIPRSSQPQNSSIQASATYSITTLEPFPKYVYQLLLEGASPKRRGHTWSRSCYDAFVAYCKEKCGATNDPQRLEHAYFYLWFYFCNHPFHFSIPCYCFASFMKAN